MAQSVVPSEGPEAPNPAEPHAPASNRFFALTLGSIGVVYGDIGTSPLYAFREALVAARRRRPSAAAAVLGVLSLILWALDPRSSRVKYVLILLRADNNGEGGTLTLDGAGAARGRRRFTASYSGSASSARPCFSATR